RLGAADMLYCGIATHHCPSDRFESLLDDLGRSSVVTEVLDRHATDAGVPPLTQYRAVIDRCFSADAIEEILGRLDRESGDWATGGGRRQGVCARNGHGASGSCCGSFALAPTCPTLRPRCDWNTVFRSAASAATTSTRACAPR